MPDAVAAWLAAHHSVISRTEALRLGMSDRQISLRLRHCSWARVFPGVYRLVGAPFAALSATRAAVLHGGPEIGRLTHDGRVALGSHGLIPGAPHHHGAHHPDHPHRRAAGGPLPDPRRGGRAPGHPVHDGGSDPARLRGGGTAAELDDLVDRAVARQAVRVDAITDVLGRPAMRHYPGRRRLERRLEERGVMGSPAPSVLESRMARLFVRHHLPVPKAEVVWGADRRYRLDFAYPELRLAIEVDGWSAHFTPEKLRSDNRRTNALTRAGWTVLRYTWWDVSFDADRVAREIADAYRDRALVG